MIKGILFDKDGTLIEFTATWHQVITYILNDLEKKFYLNQQIIADLKEVSGYEDSGFIKESIIQYYSTTQIIEKWYDTIAKYGDMNSITKSLLLELFETNAVREDVDIKLLDGVKDLLSYLNDRGYFIGIATADTKHSAEFSLKKAKIYDYFDYIGADDSKNEAKPCPQMALDFCEKVGIDRRELLIVGDSVTDMIFAKNAGADFIGVETLYNNSNQFIENNYRTVDIIYKIIEEFNL